MPLTGMVGRFTTEESASLLHRRQNREFEWDIAQYGSLKALFCGVYFLSMMKCIGTKSISTKLREREMWALFGPVLSNISYFVSNLRTCWLLFTGLNNAMAYQKWQWLGILVPSYIVDRFKKLFSLYAENCGRRFCTYKKTFLPPYSYPIFPMDTNHDHHSDQWLILIDQRRMNAWPLLSSCSDHTVQPCTAVRLYWGHTV